MSCNDIQLHEAIPRELETLVVLMCVFAYNKEHLYFIGCVELRPGDDLWMCAPTTAVQQNRLFVALYAPSQVPASHHYMNSK